MFKFYELITSISTINKKFYKISRGLNIAYAEPKANKFFLELVAKENYK